MPKASKEVSLREAAQMLGICLDSAYSLVWAGKLEGFKRDGRWSIPVGAIENRIEKRSS